MLFLHLVDALKGIGHACGHNLIAIAGVAAAISTASALSSSNTSGKVVLLGTPAEENGGGKAVILDEGGYEGMEACLMCVLPRSRFQPALPLLSRAFAVELIFGLPLFFVGIVKGYTHSRKETTPALLP